MKKQEEGVRYCGNCGRRCLGGTTFCPSCGTKLEYSDDEGSSSTKKSKSEKEIKVSPEKSEEPKMKKKLSSSSSSPPPKASNFEEFNIGNNSVGVYVLELEGGFHYVGHASEMKSRIIAHFGGNGSAWTKLHHPVRISEIIPGGDLSAEENKTIELMGKYGPDKVRGGPWVEVRKL